MDSAESGWLIWQSKSKAAKQESWVVVQRDCSPTPPQSLGMPWGLLLLEDSICLGSGVFVWWGGDSYPLVLE